MSNDYKNLGDFVREFECEGVTFYVRGLTVAEYADLAEQRLLKLNDRMFVEIAVCGIVGWEDFYIDGEEIKYGEPYTAEHIIDDNPDPNEDTVLVKIGKHIYHKLTILDDEDASKFEGFIRFLYWSSKDENEIRSDTYDCETCLKKGLAVKRPCGRFDMEYRKSFLKTEKDNEEIKNKTSKYSNSNLQKKKKAKLDKYSSTDNNEEDVEPKVRNGGILVGDFKYPECPISWIDQWIKVVGEVMYHAEKTEIPIFEGGLMDQPYMIYRASKVVKSEFSAIEEEERQERLDNN